jgi:acyl carrier protein
MHNIPESDLSSIRQRVFDKLYALIELSPGAAQAHDLSPDTRLTDLGMDSLRLLEIVFELEKHFDVEVDEALLAELATVSDLARMIVSRMSEAACDVRV